MSKVVRVMSKKALPKVDGEITLQGLKDKVTIKRDTAGAPHIYATCEEDVVFAQGYCHAQDKCDKCNRDSFTLCHFNSLIVD